MNTEHLKEKLEAEKIQLEGELKSVGRQNPSNPKDWEATPGEHSPEADPNDVADTSEAFQENQAILDDLEIRYNNVTRALTKMKEGTYGTCEISGEPIEEDRLEANPAARTCKAHLDEEEKLPV
jgi:RNA polymerase-binding transcription factor DksA